MYKKGHQGVFLLVWTVISVFFLFPQGLFIVATVGFIAGFLLSSIPDKDQNIPLMGHRKQTHTVWFAILFGIGFYVIGVMMSNSFASVATMLPPEYLFFIGLVIILIHIYTDALNPSGVRPYVPASDHRHAWGVVKSGSFFGNYFFYIAGFVAFVIGIYYNFVGG